MTVCISSPDPIVLIGLPGSGKSRTGEILADRLGWRFADTDVAVERMGGETIGAMVAARGWAYFRRLESEVLMALLVRERSVIATGGGIVETPGNCVAMEAAGRIVWLSAPTEVLLARLECDPQERPLLATGGAQRLAGLARDRNPLYARIARHRVDTQGLDEYRVAEIVAGLMAEQPENRQ